MSATKGSPFGRAGAEATERVYLCFFFQKEKVLKNEKTSKNTIKKLKFHKKQTIFDDFSKNGVL